MKFKQRKANESLEDQSCSSKKASLHESGRRRNVRIHLQCRGGRSEAFFQKGNFLEKMYFEDMGTSHA